ncbi:hypothetical protein [Pandoraea iniqua]|uniref:hypothetical protein n=1 Tax=Pandoraea iniqua TaxID=2508288 RepID=UPI00123FAA1A|nr:hypothetical protein [Pandoraea iniqua]
MQERAIAKDDTSPSTERTSQPIETSILEVPRAEDLTRAAQSTPTKPMMGHDLLKQTALYFSLELDLTELVVPTLPGDV